MLVMSCCGCLVSLFVLSSMVIYSTGLPSKVDNAQQVRVTFDGKAMRFLQDKGYYVPSFSADAGQIKSNGDELSSALRDFQRFANIPVTGSFDADTKNMMESPRCGMPDLYKKSELRKRKRRYNLQGSKWRKSVITWAVENENNDGITKEQVSLTMRRSFNKWQSVTNLEFRELVNARIGAADIRVRFVRGTHDDSYPFDGEGGTLAHAFYPHDNTGLAGDVHFDDDEKYTIEDSTDRSKKKLLWVAVHELGHSIGLEHSNLKGAIMYPWYQHFEGSDFDLTDDDRLGIQTLYGGKETPVTNAPPQTTSGPTRTQQTVKKSQCTNRIGAALYFKDKRTYIFNGDSFYVLFRSAEGMGVEEGPSLTSSKFSDLDRVDAVFRRPHETNPKEVGNIVFFHGDKFSVYDGFRKVSNPRKISDGFEKLPEGIRDIDAAYFDVKLNKLYLYKSDKYWRFSTRFNSVDFAMDNNYPQKIATRWRGLPSTVDSAMVWDDKKTYFFKDDLYYRWNHETRAVHKGYPQKLSSTFLECEKGAFQTQRKEFGDPTGSSSAVIFPSFVTLILSYVLFRFAEMM